MYKLWTCKHAVCRFGLNCRIKTRSRWIKVKNNVTDFSHGGSLYYSTPACEHCYFLYSFALEAQWEGTPLRLERNQLLYFFVLSVTKKTLPFTCISKMHTTFQQLNVNLISLTRQSITASKHSVCVEPKFVLCFILITLAEVLCNLSFLKFRMFRNKTIIILVFVGPCF